MTSETTNAWEAESRETESGGATNAGLAVVAYLFGPLTGLLVLAIAGDETVRFHAAQSVALGVVAATGSFLLGVVGAVTALLDPFLASAVGIATFGWTLACLAAWGVGLLGALRGRRSRLPVAGCLATKLAGR